MIPLDAAFTGFVPILIAAVAVVLLLAVIVIFVIKYNRSNKKGRGNHLIVPVVEKKRSVSQVCAEISARFTEAASVSVENEILRACKSVGEAMSVQHVAIWLADENQKAPDAKSRLELGYHWDSAAVEPMHSEASCLDLAIFPLIHRRYAEGEPILILNVEKECKSNGTAEKNLLDKLNCGGIGLFPLRCGGRVCGIVGYISVGSPLELSEASVADFRRATALFSTALDFRENKIEVTSKRPPLAI